MRSASIRSSHIGERAGFGSKAVSASGCGKLGHSARHVDVGITRASRLHREIAQVSEGPKETSKSFLSALFDHLVGAREHGRWNVGPGALAVLRFVTSSHLVGACTGKSADFSRFRVRSISAA